MESKLRECFDEMVVYKDLKRSNHLRKRASKDSYEGRYRY